VSASGNGSISRRDFIRTSGAGVLAVSALGAGALSCAKKEADLFKGFKVGVQSYTFRKFTVIEAIEKVKALGLSYIEIYPGQLPVDSSDEKIAEVQQCLDDNGIKLVAYGVCGFEGNDEAAFRPYFDLAKKTGIECISANPTAEALPVLDKLVAEYGVNIGIHNHGPKAIYDKIDDVLSACEGRNAGIGACIDSGHFIRSDEDPVRAAKLLGARVHGIHIKDFIDVETETVIGEGKLDVSGFLQALKDADFDGTFSIEFELSPENPSPEVEECVDAIKAALKKVV
jgi:sugar phosphate isomerase/epimerase